MTIPWLGLTVIVLSLVWVGLVLRHTSSRESTIPPPLRHGASPPPVAGVPPLAGAGPKSIGFSSSGSQSATPSGASHRTIAVSSGPPLPQDPNANQPVVASRDEPVPGASNLVRRTRIIRTTFKYPLWRVEELLARDPKTGTETAVGRATMVANHVLLRLQAGAMIDQIETLAAQIGAHVIRTLHSPGLYLVGVPNADPDTVPRLLTALNREGTVVRYAEPDYIIHVTQTQPNDSQFAELWGMNNTGQTGGAADADIDAPEAWDIATGNSDVVVAVVDTGIDINHPDLVSNIWSNPLETVNGVDDDGNGFIDDIRGWDFVNHDNSPLDDYGHGTHVAGTIAASGNNSAGVVGVNWQARIMALKFIDSSGSGATSDAIEALQYAASLRRSGINVRITNNSWGDTNGIYSTSLSQAIQDQGEAGILFVAAAGNWNHDNDASPFYPASYPWSNIISVAATDHHDAKASFSHYGLTSVDLGAPGVNILSTTVGGGYDYMSGTSMATPHVAGVAALLWSTRPDASWQDVRKAILNGTDPVSSMFGKTVTGGRLNAYKALLSFFDIIHTPRTDTFNNGDPYEINAIVGPEHLTGTNALRVFWNTDGSTNFSSNPMTGVSNTLYRGSIPIQTEGTTVYYWIKATPPLSPSVRHPSNAPTDLHSFKIVPPMNITVSANTNVPVPVSPDYGQHTYPSGVVLHATADAFLDLMDGTRWLCEGWTGTGSVPESGNSNAITFALSLESTLKWLWREELYPLLNLTPDALDLFLRPDTVSNVYVSVSNTGKTNLTLDASLLSRAFADDAEKGSGDWAHSGTRDLWTLTTNRSVSGSNAWYCGNAASHLYATNMHARLDTPPITLGDGAQLTFWHWIESELDYDYPGYAYDGGIVEISTNSGLTFTQIEPIGDYSHKVTGYAASPWPQDTPCFAGAGGWQQVTFDLSTMAHDSAIIRFHFGSDGSVEEEGWYLDDIVVTPDSSSNLWLSLTPTHLDLPAGRSTNLTVTFNTTGIPTGDLQSAIQLACNDASTPTSVVPVFVRVAPVLGFTVSASTNVPASVSPDYGHHTFESGIVVKAQANTCDLMDGTRWICAGWTGTGSVPESGNSNAVTFMLSLESTLEWLWREESYPLLSLAPEAIETFVRPNTVSNVSVSVSNTGKTNLILNAALLSMGFTDDSEKEAGGWTHSGTRDLWTLTTNRFVSSSNAWYCGNAATCLYTTNMHARLDTPPIVLGYGAQLTFWHWIKCEIDHTSGPGYAWDGGIVEISTNAGLTFTQIAPVGGYSHKMSEWSASPWEQDTPCFAGTGSWQQVTFDLGALSDKIAIIRFHFGSDQNTQEEGWYLDDVVVTPDSQSNLWLSITPAQIDVPAGGSTNLTVTMNTTGIPTGERQSAIRLDGNAPFRIIPVTLAVRSPAVLSCLQAAQTSTQGEGLVTISNLIHDADGDTCALDVAWSASGGASWSNLTILAAQDLLGLITLNPSNGPPVENIQTAVSALNFTNSLTLTWNTSASGSDILLNPGVIIRGRAWDGLYWSDWTTSQPFMVDNEPPGSPGEITSATHTPSSWSTNSLLTVQWPAANDGAGVGISSYDYGVGAHAPACTTTGRTVGLSVNSLPLADGSNGFVIVRARDHFGNTGAVAVGGPYWVDTAPPSATNATVTLVHSPFGNYLVGATSVTGTWSGFSDSASGIRDYYYASSNQAGSTNGILTTLATGVLSNTQIGATNRFFVWAADNAGLISPAVESFCLILDAAGDQDHDLISNADEELTGTDAGNPASVLRLTALQPEPVDEFVLQWPALTNRFYTLYYRDGLLTDTNWLTVPGFIDVPGFSGTMAHTGLTSFLPSRFYKITVRAP